MTSRIIHIFVLYKKYMINSNYSASGLTLKNLTASNCVSVDLLLIYEGFKMTNYMSQIKICGANGKLDLAAYLRLVTVAITTHTFQFIGIRFVIYLTCRRLHSQTRVDLVCGLFVGT